MTKSYSTLFLSPSFTNIQTFLSILVLSLTHTGYDAVHRQPGGGVVEASDGQALVVLLLLLEDKSRVLLLGDVDVVASVSGGHDVARARVQEDALVVFPLHSNQTNAIPAKQASLLNVLPQNNVLYKINNKKS